VAAVLNYIPYLGAIVTLMLIAAAALFSFDTLGPVLVATGGLLRPEHARGQPRDAAPAGPEDALNPVSIFVGLLFWGWLWGVTGALLAVPLTVMVKIICDHVTGPQGRGGHCSTTEATTPYSSLSGVIGSSRIRLPVAWNTAFRDRRRHADHRDLAEPLHAQRVDVRVVFVHERHVHLGWRVGVDRDRIFGEVGVRHPPVPGVHHAMLHEGHADAADHAADALAARQSSG
jgi:hypothetical protein